MTRVGGTGGTGGDGRRRMVLVASGRWGGTGEEGLGVWGVILQVSRDLTAPTRPEERAVFLESYDVTMRI